VNNLPKDDLNNLGSSLRNEYNTNKNRNTMSSKANYSQQVNNSQKEDENECDENCSQAGENSNLEMEELEES
jgi:hypothetical protein